MTDRLSALLHEEAQHLTVAPADAAEVLTRGRGLRRRRRVAQGLTTVAVVAVVGVGAAFAFGGSPDRAADDRTTVADDGHKPVVPEQEFPPAFAAGNTLYLDGGATAVRMDEVVQQIYYTSAGLLVRTNKDGASDGGAPFHFVLVAPDGTTQKLGLTLGEVVPGVDPTQPLLAYADMAGDTEQVVVHDLTTDQDVARFDVPGQMTWGGWPAPPVALSGDLVFVGNDTPVAVNWRTGEVTTTDAMPEGMPVVNGGRTVLSVGKAAEVVDLASGETLLTVPDAAEGFQLLSPDGRYVRIGAWDKPDGFDVYGVDSGSVVSLRGQTYQYGWTADGRLFTVSGDSLKVCSPTTGDCSDQPLPDGLSFGKDEFLRYAGSIYES
jgi:hypothetical protein